MTDPQSNKDNSRLRNPWPDSVYENLRKKLIMYFEKRGLSPAEEYAHKVIERLLVIFDRLFAEGLKEKDTKYEGLVNLLRDKENPNTASSKS